MYNLCAIFAVVMVALIAFGAGSDHIDHFKTQLPYASTAATAALVVSLTIGILS